MDPGPISIILLSLVYFTRTIYFTRIILLFSTRYAYNLCFKQTGEIDNLIASWEQSIWLCVCRFRVATSRRRVNKCRKWCPCWSAIKPVRITFSHNCLLLSWPTYLGFLTEGNLAAIFIIPSSWGSQLAGYLLHQLGSINAPLIRHDILSTTLLVGPTWILVAHSDK
jgi:hypothetical protein